MRIHDYQEFGVARIPGQEDCRICRTKKVVLCFCSFLVDALIFSELSPDIPYGDLFRSRLMVIWRSGVTA